MTPTESALTALVGAVAQLRDLSSTCGQAFDLCLGPIRPSPESWTAESALWALRNLVAYLWTTLVPALYRELVRQLDASDEPAEIAQRQLAARLGLLRQQTLELLCLAVVEQARILTGSPELADLIPTRLGGVLECADLWVGAAMEGLVRLDLAAAETATKCVRIVASDAFRRCNRAADPSAAVKQAVTSVQDRRVGFCFGPHGQLDPVAGRDRVGRRAVRASDIGSIGPRGGRALVRVPTSPGNRMGGTPRKQ